MYGEGANVITLGGQEGSGERERILGAKSWKEKSQRGARVWVEERPWRGSRKSSCT